jgi:hypothetical protein
MKNNLIEIYLNFLNQSYYIYETSGSSIARQIRSGNLSPEAIEKLKKAGLIKPEEEYRKGIEKGIKKSLRWKKIKWDEIDHKTIGHDKSTVSFLKSLPEEELKNNYNMSKTDLEKMEKIATKTGKVSVGPVTMPDEKIISIPKKMDSGMMKYAFGSKKDYEKLKPLIKRHEADEYLLAQKLKKKYKIKGSMDPGPLPNLNVAGGGHMGPEILKKEKKLVDFYDKVYGKLTHWTTIRQPEYEELKKYGSSRAIRKARERGIKKGIIDVLNISDERVVNSGFTTKQNFLKSIKPQIVQQIKMLPKSKRNITFVTKVLKIIK